MKNHLLQDSGEPESICITEWFSEVEYNPAETFPVQSDKKLSRIAGQRVHAQTIEYLIPKLYAYSVKFHDPSQVLCCNFAHSDPIFIWTGLNQKHFIYVKIREFNESHVLFSFQFVNFPLLVLSHLWLQF